MMSIQRNSIDKVSGKIGLRIEKQTEVNRAATKMYLERKEE